jgi:hypothetical protein
MHVAQGGLDPAKQNVDVILEAAGLIPPAKRTRRGGCNAYLAFSNIKRQAIKAVLAPDRSMTSEERQTMEATIAGEWCLVQEDPEEHALWSLAGKRMQEASQCAIAAVSEFKSPCSISTDRRQLIDPQLVARASADHKAIAVHMCPILERSTLKYQ